MQASKAITEILDEEIRQLIELKRMAANPRLVDLMRQIVSASNAGGPEGTARRQQPNLPGLHEDKPQDVGTQESYLPNGLTAASWEAIRGIGRQFTLGDVVAKLDEAGFKFVAAKPKVAVAAPIKSFIKRGHVTLVKRGFGSEPNIYDLTEAGKSSE